MVVINGVKATKNDLQILCKWLRLKKIKILFFRLGDIVNYITT